MTDRHPNLQPEGWRELTLDEFASSTKFFIYSSDQSYGGTLYPPQADDPTKPDFTNRDRVVHRVKLFTFYDGTGAAMAWDGRKVQFFRFGCEHKYRELTQEECRNRDIVHHGRCWHVNECSKCGHIDSYDSSD